VGNDYLEGNYAPVRRECTITELVVTGTIPAHLDGRYLRNGPNPIGEVDPDTYHWFTGDGMVHGVRLRDGKAQWYRNRWIRTPAAARALGETVPRRAPIRAGLEFLGADRSDLVLLDASSLEVIAAIHLPVRVPFGFHGNWLPSAPRPTTH